MSELLIKSCDINKLRDETYELQRWTLLHSTVAANSVYIVIYIFPESFDERDTSKPPQYSLIHIAARMGH